MSGRQDLNLRPFAPKANALPDCATPRVETLTVSMDQSKEAIKFITNDTKMIFT